MTEDTLAMLEVRASGALPGWVAEQLRARFPGARTRVLRVYPGRAARVKGVAAFEAFAVAEGTGPDKAVRLEDDAALIDALRRRTPLAACDGAEPRLVATFETAGEVGHVVELRGAGPGAAEAVGPLVAIARKYYERLVDGETDPLTRLANRRLFQEQVDAGAPGWTTSGRAYFFAMMDLDRFKRVNDRFGHLYGDEILVHFANLMRATFRAGDRLYRFGGEEFVVIFAVGAFERRGETILERFRAAVEAYDFPGVGQVTVSIGFTRIADVTPAAMLIDRADEALYWVKAHGRNRVACWEDLVRAGEIDAKPAPRGDVTLWGATS